MAASEFSDEKTGHSDREMLAAIHTEVLDIRRTLKGDSYSERPGVLQRLQEVEKRQEEFELRDTKRSWSVKGGVAVVSSSLFIAILGLFMQLFGGQ